MFVIITIIQIHPSTSTTYKQRNKNVCKWSNMKEGINLWISSLYSLDLGYNYLIKINWVSMWHTNVYDTQILTITLQSHFYKLNISIQTKMPNIYHSRNIGFKLGTVCTHFTQFPISIPNMGINYIDSDMFWTFCGILIEVCCLHSTSNLFFVINWLT